MRKIITRLRFQHAGKATDMSERNLNPHAEARVAMALWSERYSKQKLGCMDFYDGLTAAQKSTCAQIVNGIIYADRADGRTPAPHPISVVAEPKRWLAEWTLPSGSIRWQVFEHEHQARVFQSGQPENPRVTALYDHPEPAELSMGGKFGLGDRVRKTKGSSWQGRVVGFYSTDLTSIGYAVESEREQGSVQIYPESALAALASTEGTEG